MASVSGYHTILFSPASGGPGGDFSGCSQYGVPHHEISNEGAGAAPGTHEGDRRRAEASGSKGGGGGDK